MQSGIRELMVGNVSVIFRDIAGFSTHE